MPSIKRQRQTAMAKSMFAALKQKATAPFETGSRRHGQQTDTSRVFLAEDG